MSLSLTLFWNPVENTLHGSSFHQPWDQNTTSQPVFGQDFQPSALNSNVSKAEMQYACFIFVSFTFTLRAFSRRCYPNWHTIVDFNCLNTFWKTWLIESKLNTQANTTEKYTIRIYVKLRLLLNPNNPHNVKMSLWRQNDTHAAYEYTFRSAATH